MRRTQRGRVLDIFIACIGVKRSLLLCAPGGTNVQSELLNILLNKRMNVRIILCVLTVTKHIFMTNLTTHSKCSSLSSLYINSNNVALMFNDKQDVALMNVLFTNECSNIQPLS